MALRLGGIARRALALFGPGTVKAERDAALAREAATSDVLRLIASAPDDLAPVFKTILAHAVRLCEAAEGWLFLRDGIRFKPVAHIGVSERLRIHPRDGFEPGPTYTRMIEAHGPIQVEERAAEWEDAERYRLRVALGIREAKKTGLYVPMFRGPELIGAIHVHRREMLTFTAEQMALVANFAEQALVAIDNARLLGELRVAVDRQAASADVLGVISASPSALAPAFDAMLDHAMRICAAERGGLLQFDAGKFRLYAHKGWPQELVDALADGLAPGPGSSLGRMVRENRTIHVVDTGVDEFHDPDHGEPETGADGGARRTQLFVPMLKDDEIIGAFAVARKSSRPFSDTEIDLVETFAKQAVIAIGNARLLGELRLSLDRQSATAEVLSVIAASPGELEPVFAAMLENAIRICAAKIGWLFVRDGEMFRLAATLGLSPDYVAVANRIARRRGPETAIGRLAALRRTVQIEDLQSADSLARGDPFPLFAAEENIRSALAVPMLKDDDILGAIVIFRQESAPFMSEQVALVENFAAQAVVAIENSRLVTDLTESHGREQATADMVGAIASSAGDLGPVFDALLENATRLTEAETGIVFRFEAGSFHAAATRGVSPALGDILRQAPVRRGMRSVFAQIAARKETIHLLDAMEGPGQRSGDGAPAAAASLGGIRTSLFVPMVKEGALVGVVQIFRYEVRPFTERQIALVEALAAQAAIAIENTRLLTELRLSDDRQAATAGLLRIMASSEGDLQPVFDTMLSSAVAACGADFAILRRRDGDLYRAVAHHGVPPALADFMTQHPALPSPESLLERTNRTAHATDLAISPAYAAGKPHAVATVELGGAHSSAVVPLLQDGHVVGEIELFRQEVKPFTGKQIELIESFAAHAVIAMENARLRETLAARERDLDEANDRQTASAELLRLVSAAPGELAPLFETMLEKAVLLCEAQTGVLYRRSDDAFEAIASSGMPEAVLQSGGLRRAVPQPGSNWAQVVETKATLHCHDLTQSAGYRRGDPGPLAAADIADMRTVLYVPLVTAGEVVGVLILFRGDVRPFAGRQIELAEMVAAEAAIAIETARLAADLDARTHAVAAAVREQSATLAVLGAMATSPGDAAPAFAVLLDGVARVCDAPMGQLLGFDGASFRVLAARGLPVQDHPFEVPADSDLMAMVMGREAVHQPDLAASPAYRRGHPPTVEAVETDGVRTALYVPMMKEARVIGALAAIRTEARAFSDRHIDLAKDFAAQAVTAAENARNLAELRNALDRETATGDVLKVISRSAVDLDAVLQTVVTAAVRLCRAEYAGIFRNEGGEFRWAAGHGLTDDYVQYERANPIRAGTGTLVGRVALEGHIVRIDDAWTDPLYEAKESARAVNARGMLGVPLLRDKTVIGIIGLARSTTEPFSEREVQLVTTFADQAVIAIENARLLTELRESLERQIATSDVLRVISASPGELTPVYEAMLDNAIRVCDAGMGFIGTVDADGVHVTAVRGISPEQAAVFTARPWRPPADSAATLAVATKRPVQVEDIRNAPAHRRGDPFLVGVAEGVGMRTLLLVPMLKDGAVVGGMGIFRQEVRPFTGMQIGLLENFAAQAVIAIENARLLSELRARTDALARAVEEQKALADVIQAVNSSLDLNAVLATIVSNAARLSATEAGAIYVFDGSPDELRPRATHGMDESLIEAITGQQWAAGATALHDATATRGPVQIADLSAESPNPMIEVIMAAGFRAVLVVPLIGPDRMVGALVVRRRAPGVFEPATVDLLATFGAQSVIAIENARLFGEIEEKGRELAVASQHKSQFLANMSHELRTPLNAILGYTELILDDLYGAAPPRMREVLIRVESNGKRLLGLINDVLDFSKIEAGEMTLALADYSVGDLVRGVFAAVEPLASEKRLALRLDLPDGLPRAFGDERRLSQVLLNLVGNAIKFTDAGEVRISAAAANGSLTLAVHDTGPGIAPEDQARIFEEFQQADNSMTHKKGGTGLGLAISRRIVELHGGSIGVQSEPGRGATFSVILPLSAGVRLSA